MKEFNILIKRRTLQLTKVKVVAKNYNDAIEKSLIKARNKEVDWSKEEAIIQYDYDNLDLESPPFTR